jgi:hypothetical protein
MGLADRWGRKMTIIYYSIISIIGDLRLSPLKNRLCIANSSSQSCNDDRRSIIGGFRDGCIGVTGNSIAS